MMFWWVGSLGRIQSTLVSLEFMLEEYCTHVLDPVPVVWNHIRCLDGNSQSAGLVEDLPPSAHKTLHSPSIPKRTSYEQNYRYQPQSCHKTMSSPPLPDHLWITSYLAIRLRLHFAIPSRVHILRMRADHDCRHLFWWRHDRCQPFIIHHETRHDNEGDL